MSRCAWTVALVLLAAPAWADELMLGEPFVVAGELVRSGVRVQRQPAVAAGGGIYLVAWSDGSRQADQPTADIFCARIDGVSGRSLDPRGIRVCGAGDVQEWPAVAFDGRTFLVVWQDFRDGKQHDIYAAHVSPSGRVLDPEGFPVAAGPANEARPAVAFAGGHFVVAWMDARTYPVYGIWAARVTPEGKVVDPGGRAVDAEDPARVGQAKPPKNAWMGDRDGWWRELSSRYLPVAAADGRRCLVAYLREYPYAGNPRTGPTAVVIDGADGRLLAGPARLPSGAHDALAACATPRGWAVVLHDHARGWDLAPRLAAVRLDADLRTEDRFAVPETMDPDSLPLEDLGKSFVPMGGQTLNPGKGAVAFWRPAAAWDGRQVVAAFDFGWRQGGAVPARYVIALNRLALEAAQFSHRRADVLAQTQAADQVVANPAAASAGTGETLIVWERDEAADRQVIVGRQLRAR